MITGKTCVECKIPKPISEFYSSFCHYKKKNKSESEYIHYTSRCKPCHSEHIANQRLNRKDYYKQKRKEYFKKNPSARLLANKHNDRWEKRNPERVKEFRKKYYKKNRKQIIEIAADWRQTNHEYMKRWQQEYYQENKKSILRKARRFYFANRERILARQKERRAYLREIKLLDNKN